MAFEEHYHEVLELLEKLFIYIFRGLKERFSDDIEVVRKQYPVHEFKIPEVGKVLRLSFAEGVRMLVEDKAVAAEGNPPSELGDLNIAQEKRLGELIHAKYGEDFYVLDNFPLALRPFYAMPSPTDPQLSNAYDIFIRGEEIMSGGQRIHDPKLLEERMRSMNPPIDPDSDGLRDYVEAFRYGAPLHGGGGIGLERFVFLYLGIPNIRMASAFPRDPHRLRP
ncbi:MAG: hypothetical protein M1840_002238 [Geoglossum simile]|nr:MAG: hypothetical protein M1840_002238 [Geoglossum simile]